MRPVVVRYCFKLSVSFIHACTTENNAKLNWNICVTLCFVQLFMSENNDKVCKMLLKNRGYHFFNLFPMTV